MCVDVYFLLYIQFINDWTLALFVMILVVLDLVVLVSFTAIVGGLNLSIVDRVPHKENPQDIEGVMNACSPILSAPA